MTRRRWARRRTCWRGWRPWRRSWTRGRRAGTSRATRSSTSSWFVVLWTTVNFRFDLQPLTRASMARARRRPTATCWWSTGRSWPGRSARPWSSSSGWRRSWTPSPAPPPRASRSPVMRKKLLLQQLLLLSRTWSVVRRLHVFFITICAIGLPHWEWLLWIVGVVALDHCHCELASLDYFNPQIIK